MKKEFIIEPEGAHQIARVVDLGEASRIAASFNPMCCSQWFPRSRFECRGNSWSHRALYRRRDRR